MIQDRSVVLGAPVAAGTATISAGSVSKVTFSGNEMIVTLSSINDAQVVTVTANKVTSATGTLASVAVNVSFLQGAVDGEPVGYLVGHRANQEPLRAGRRRRYELPERRDG